MRRPNQAYELTAADEGLFPKRYGLRARQLFEVLSEKRTKAMTEIIRGVAQRIAADYRPAVTASGLRERAEQVAAVLAQLGGLAEVEEPNGRLAIRSFACPVAAAVTGNQEVCRVIEAFLADLIGEPVLPRCQAGPQPRCYFSTRAARR